jgi:metal-responsive CopG/Arc/MetJ family transcriptional regulator
MGIPAKTPVQKFAISVPAPVMALVDRAAKKRRMTRSGFISRVLRVSAAAQSDEELSARVDAFFADSEMLAEQKKTADEFLAISVW